MQNHQSNQRDSLKTRKSRDFRLTKTGYTTMTTHNCGTTTLPTATPADTSMAKA